jgi:hypothetical protein
VYLLHCRKSVVGLFQFWRLGRCLPDLVHRVLVELKRSNGRRSRLQQRADGRDGDSHTCATTFPSFTAPDRLRQFERGRAMSAEALESYLGGKWSRGEGVETELVDPTNGTVLATASARGLDFKAAVLSENAIRRRFAS